MTQITNLPVLTTITNTANVVIPVIDTGNLPNITKQINLGQVVALSVGPIGFAGSKGTTGFT